MALTEKLKRELRGRGHALKPVVTIGGGGLSPAVLRELDLSLEHHEGTSILNLLPGTVTEIADDVHAALTLVRVEVGATPIVARVTRRSAAALGLAAGTRLWVQIKAVALIG